MPLPTTATVPFPRQLGYEARLDDFLLRLARSPERPLSIAAAPKQANRIQTEQNAEDFLPEYGDVFSRNDFTGGQGLDFAHTDSADEIDRRRFFDSVGIDIGVDEPGVIEGARLLNDTESLWTTTATNLHMTSFASGHLFFAEGSAVWSVSSPGIPSPSRSTEDPHTGTQDVEGVAALGDEVYAAVGTDGIGKRSSGGTWADLASATNCFGVWAVKSRIIADSGGGLIQTIDLTTGAPTILITMDTNVRINDVVDAGAAILIVTDDGTIYSLTDESGTLTLQSQAELSEGDIVTSIAYSAGVVILTSDAGGVGRIWRASLGDANRGFQVSEVQLLKELAFVPKASTVHRDRIYLACQESTTEVVLWRYQIKSAGLARDLSFPISSSNSPIAVVSTADRLFVSVDGEDIFRDDTTKFVGSSYLISPLADFFSPNSKAWIGVTIEAQNIGNGNNIVVKVSTDPDALFDPLHASWEFIANLSSQTQISDEIILTNTEGRYATVMVELSPGGTQDETPILNSFALRAYSDSEDVILRIPVNVSDQIERPNRRPLRVRNWGHQVFTALLGFDGQFIEFELYRPPLVVRGVVESIDNPVIARSVRGSATTYALMQIRGKIVGSGSQAGNGPFAVELLGINRLGVGA